MPINHGINIDNSEILSIEQHYSIILPESYRAFLKKYNGFYVEDPDACNLTYHGVDDGEIAFDSLFGINIENENFNLIEMNNNYLDELLFIKNSFIIGTDPGGNFYILVTEGKHEGVYYWDRTHLHVEDDVQDIAFSEVDECGNLYKVSHSFEEFFKQILSQTEDKGMKLIQGL
ncbi:SMI1/KNR4 family protein [Photorhabdus khanii]|uniref:SMI1/KNR4 family protein n=1 Tax=Photorhabdus khanii subsp. guanajuatensis TaxID=2100166 RepID=A0A4R4JWB1_9GAMM|nr:SMI1/KNR4 family protein [Photorhabdus khanii]TDB58201.1 SMI1/KNR4 family protein [Photorhabdus khanii subsp. guanajuatensis]